MMEIYWASEEPSVLLIHHASEATQGLRRMAAPITARHHLPDLQRKSRGGNFSPKMCFRRGLILTRGPVANSPKFARRVPVSIN